MNIREDLTKLLMESYDRGVEDSKQAAIEGIQKAILLEREECAKVLDEMAEDMEREMEPSTAIAYVRSKAATIRARGETK